MHTNWFARFLRHKCANVSRNRRARTAKRCLQAARHPAEQPARKRRRVFAAAVDTQQSAPRPTLAESFPEYSPLARQFAANQAAEGLHTFSCLSMFNTVPIGAATSAVDAPAVGDFCLLKSQKEYGCVFAINPCSIVKFVKRQCSKHEGSCWRLQWPLEPTQLERPEAHSFGPLLQPRPRAQPAPDGGVFRAHQRCYGVSELSPPNRNSTEGKNAIQAFVAEALQQLSEMNHCEQGSGLWADVFQDVACVQLHDDASMMLACPKNLPGCRIQRRGSLGCILQS